MEQHYFGVKEFKDIWEQHIQKLILRLSAIIKMDPNEVMEEELILLDKTE